MKITAALRVLGYASGYDEKDESFGISESTLSDSFRHFCDAVPKLFPEYLRLPTQDEVVSLMERNKDRGFPGMMFSIDCTVIKWRNCPMALKAQYCGPKTKTPTIQLEACADERLYIWHAFFGMPGSSNDINVLRQSRVCLRKANCLLLRPTCTSTHNEIGK